MPDTIPDPTETEIARLRGELQAYKQSFQGTEKRALIAEANLERYNQWVDDLQSGMYVNCVYCGHRYGPGETTPVTMAEALKQHVQECPQHPMSELRRVAIAAWHALKSYEHGNSSADLAKEMCATLESTLGIDPERPPAVEKLNP
jgi:ribosomal protein L37AE/L43A